MQFFLSTCARTAGDTYPASQTSTSRSLLAVAQYEVVQGIVGSTPWNAMVFFTLWLQLLGFSDYSASVLMALFAGGCAIGSAVGGYLGQSLTSFCSPKP